MGTLDHTKKRLNSYTVKSKKEESNNQQRNNSCLVCEKGHIIDQCKEFMGKSSKEKKILAKGNSYFRCYQPMTENHIPVMCRSCGEFPPTGMHDYMKREKNEDHEHV